MGKIIEKSVLASKTFYMGLLTALVPLLPGMGEFIASNVEAISMVWGVLAIILRLLTKNKVVLKK